ncbi:MAG: hypothetical protein NC336_00255 [Clostridium sp.]|nr:hypothetical protein [Clostridium sp.]
MIRKLLFLTGLMLSAASSAFGGNLDDRLRELGYIDLGQADTTLVVDLMYGRDDNFVGVRMYDGLTRAFLHPDAAGALLKASATLRSDYPGYRLKICDAARPMSVQRRMYDKVRGTPQAPYVSNPANGGGLHNYGLAVDITVVDSLGRELDMGTPVDHLGPEANIDREKQLVASGKMTEQARLNREMLRRVMKSAGFTPLRSEWWHFNLVSRPYARAHYRVLDF